MGPVALCALVADVQLGDTGSTGKPDSIDRHVADHQIRYLTG